MRKCRKISEKFGSVWYAFQGPDSALDETNRQLGDFGQTRAGPIGITTSPSQAREACVDAHLIVDTFHNQIVFGIMDTCPQASVRDCV